MQHFDEELVRTIAKLPITSNFIYNENQSLLTGNMYKFIDRQNRYKCRASKRTVVRIKKHNKRTYAFVQSLFNCCRMTDIIMLSSHLTKTSKRKRLHVTMREWRNRRGRF